MREEAGKRSGGDEVGAERRGMGEVEESRERGGRGKGGRGEMREGDKENVKANRRARSKGRRYKTREQ